MPKFSRKSKDKLDTCHTDLQRLFSEVVKTYDCTIIQGHRTLEEQEELYRQGLSQLKGGKSKHNKNPSYAVDVAPYHKQNPNIDWNCTGNFYLFAGYVLGMAQKMNIKIRWGGSWDGSNDIRKNKFNDLVHFELDL